MIRMLILVLLLVPLSAPAATAAPGAAVHASMDMSMEHHAMAAEHACCDDSEMASVHASAMAEHMSCDGSCSDCQHYCGATAVALLPSFSATAALPEVQRWQYHPAHLLTRKDRLERPPMPAND
ncbi:hypothetical protein [Pseudidiomarina insulisalsae]|uniref:CopL family metal-binding regulatory protein n=1 Tax=Pseudidiomarina insulisalsae TaxID=575789 RepID=A0A432YND9_9GAMM|nr:hypothetical protein [Pseudidiomarina insulisalsae]RUO62507.1 hypothetical protein CWI71_03475 [Pseudidiomarina insulisalsae]